MKVQPTTKELIAMLYERLPELFDRAAQPALKPLTDEQIYGAILGWHSTEFSELEDEPSLIDIARAIEAAHGITEKGQS